MDSNSWAAHLFSASKRYHPALESRSGMKWDAFEVEMLMGFEDFDMADDIQEEYPCPFCSDYFDIAGLCCHIDDEHPAEANNGICPVCSVRVGIDMVAHLTLQHGNIFKRKRKSRKADSHTTLSMFKREMREANLRSLFGGSSGTISLSSSSAAPDPLLSSFISPMVEDFEGTWSNSPAESVKKTTTDIVSERKVEKPSMSMKDQEEKTKRCNFVQELLFSAMFDDNLESSPDERRIQYLAC